MDAGASYQSRIIWLSARARESPDETCLWWQRSPVSFGAMLDAVEGVAARLWAAGLRPTDRLATVCAPSLRFVELFHAVQSIGAVLVPLAPHLTATELTPLFERTSPRLVLADTAAIPTVRATTYATAGISGERCVIEALGELDQAAPAQKTTAPRESPGYVVQSDEPLTVLFTSGTCGAPKAAVLPYRAHEASARAGARRLRLTERDCWLLCMPLHHVGGISVLVRNVVCGVPFVLLESFDAAEVDRELRGGGVTAISVVPTMLTRLLDAGNDRAYPNCLRIVLTGGGPLTAGLAERARAAHVPVLTTYGLTEAASQVCTVAPGNGATNDSVAAPGSVGRPLEGTEVRIDNPGADGVGEILVKSPTLMTGYLDDPAATQAALRDGLLHTGDLGRLDAAGHLHIECRRTDLIITGGENVYPREVEAVLCSHPEIETAVVVGVDDSKWGQRVSAVVVPFSPPSPTRPADDGSHGELPKRIIDFCVTRLAKYKIPRAIVIAESLPMTPSGKIDLKAAKTLLEQS